MTDPAFTSEKRLELAATLRRLGNALVAHQPDDTLLDRVNRAVAPLIDEVEVAPDRPHAFHTRGSKPFDLPAPIAEGPTHPPRDAFPDCIVSGRANPMGINARLWREGEEAVCQVTLGEAFEGAPGRAHGGIVAALIDETMGLVTSITETLAFTGRLTVTYRAPTPVGVPLEVRARRTAATGRKLTFTAELKTGNTLLAQAEALFIAVETGHFLNLGQGIDDEA